MDIMIAIIIVLVLFCTFSTYYAVKFGLLLLRLQDDIEMSLDEIEESYEVMTDILQKPIFFDSLEVRQCVDEIKKFRNTVVKIGNRLTSFGKNENETTGELSYDEGER
tara:strand:+ start:332 stop:655 length:324 start_codon:yes stop_codon:yes gene_type:complete